MKSFFKILLFSFFLCISPIIESAAPAGLGIADAFKDLSEVELMKAIEESQKALEDLMNNGTPEQKAEFEKALTELAENLSPEDWKELQAIGEVYEKNNPYVPQQETSKEATKETSTEKKTEAKPIPDKTKNSQFEASIQENLDLIVKNIDHMFHIISAHRDLSHNLKLWEEKSSFQELKSLLIRLKKHINRLSKTSDPENKIIIDNLYAFKKDLEAENKRIAVAQDDFGLENPMTSEQADHTLTQVTLVLSTGINNLLPSLTTFFKKYEPEALEEAKKKSDQKFKAKQLEKESSQRRPSSPYFSTVPYGRNDSYNQMPQRKHRPADMNNGFHQNSGRQSASQLNAPKEHKADFGGFNMNIQRGVIQNGKAVPTPEKKKDDKKKKDGEKEDEEDKESADKKKKIEKIDPNKDFLKNMSKYISDNATKSAGSRFIDNVRNLSLYYPHFKPASTIIPINLVPIIKNAITKHLISADIDKLKREVLSGIQAAARSTAPNLNVIIAAHADLINTAIEKALIPAEDDEDTREDVDDIINMPQVKDAITKATAEINLYKDTENKELDSQQKIDSMDTYIKSLDTQIGTFEKEVDDIEIIINTLQSTIGRVDQAELVKLVKSQTFITFENKVQTYSKAVQEFRSKAEQAKNENIMLILPSYEGKYLEKHRQIFEFPKGIANRIISAKNSLSSFTQSAKVPYLSL